MITCPFLFLHLHTYLCCTLSMTLLVHNTAFTNREQTDTQRYTATTCLSSA